jgi:hypothetical protein
MTLTTNKATKCWSSPSVRASIITEFLGVCVIDDVTTVKAKECQQQCDQIVLKKSPKNSAITKFGAVNGKVISYPSIASNKCEQKYKKVSFI